YGQGSSREHAALVPLFLGVKFVIAKSFARIHRSNLINSGIIPLVFSDPSDHARIKVGHELLMESALSQIKSPEITVKNLTTGEKYITETNFSETEKAIILAGGKINYIKQEAEHEL
ncbi:MAG: aconitate hydratase, partial [Eubacteriales bacterium]|nr:aconitate hydratase [Eubacteriales bacterium]